MPDMVDVNSSNINAIGHDPESGDLHVQFKNGGHYVYHGVPQQEYYKLLAAPSKGSHFHQNIRGNYGDPTNLTKDDDSQKEI